MLQSTLSLQVVQTMLQMIEGDAMPRGRTKGWAERGEKGGRPKGSVKEGATGRLKPYKTFSVSCPLDEYERVKAKAEEQNKTISRFLLDAVKEPTE